MKKTLTLFVLICYTLLNNCFAQDNYLGSWEGHLDKVNLKLIFHFEKDANGKITAKLDSPDQNALGIPMDTVIINAEGIYTAFSKAGMSYKGKLINDNMLEGTFLQGTSFTLNLTRIQSTSKIKSQDKPQTPKPPYDYKKEDVVFESKQAGVHLAGTITKPSGDKKYPAVILISGSGPQNRDEQLGAHKPFAVIADHLTKKGFLVLRYDDRGVEKSSGDFNAATSLDFSKDAAGAVQYLRSRNDVDIKQIGLLGHSEGGMIAPIVAQTEPIAFVILLAGPGIPVIDLMAEQNTAYLQSEGMPEAAAIAYGKLYKSMAQQILTSKDTLGLQHKIEKLIYSTPELPQILNQDVVQAETVSSVARDLIQAFQTDWYKYFMKFDPQPYLQKLKMPVLALNGEKDIQVLSKSNLNGIRTALKNGHPKSEVVEMEGLNHLFQTCKDCKFKEYFELEETISVSVLDKITEWLQKITK